MISGIPHDKITDYWRAVEPWIDKAIDKNGGEFDRFHVLSCLVKKEMQLWIAAENEIDAVCVTRIDQYQNMQILRIVLLAGEGMENWMNELIDTLEVFARHCGCSRIDGTGRRGWAKSLMARNNGFTEKYVTVVKEIA